MSTPRPLWSTGQAAAQRFNRAYPGLQGGRRAGLAPVHPRLVHRRRRRPVVVDAEGWIQPANGTVAPTLVYVLTKAEGNPVNDADFPAEAEAVMDLLRTDGGASLTADIGSRYDAQTVDLLNLPVSFLSHAVLPPGFAMPNVFIPESDYPPNAIGVEYEATQGTFLSVVLNAEISRTVSEGSVLLRVPEAQWDEMAGAYGLGYFTPAELSTFTVLEDIAATSGPLSVAEPFTLDGNGGAVFVLAHDRQVSGTGWARGSGGILLWDSETTSAVVTYRPPRYRFTFADAAPWTASILRNQYVWDAGLYLGADFDTLTGYPVTLPASAGELAFYVVPAGFDFVGDASNPEPSALVAINGFGNVGPFRYPSGENTPAAGSHLWVAWSGPDFDITTDPPPDAAPAGLVPSSLAENGTG